MPEARPCGKKKKLTLVASEKGVETAEKALLRLGFESKSNFAESQRLARSTVSNFFNRVPIQLDSFKRIGFSLLVSVQITYNAKITLFYDRSRSNIQK